MTVAASASTSAIYSGVVATLALVIAAGALAWNIVNTMKERRARRSPDVFGAVLEDHVKGSYLEFANAGPAIARHLFFLMVDRGIVHEASVTLFLKAEGQVQSALRFHPEDERSCLVWAYMDADHNVHARSNHGHQHVYSHPAHVKLDEIFQRFYPRITLPRPSALPPLGEL